MNKTFIIGNLTADPETRTTKSGITVCSFTVAVDRKRSDASANRETDFFRVSAWRQLGDICRQYLSKGRKVSVLGEIHASAYINSQGKAVGRLELNAQDVEFLSPKASDPEAAYIQQERQAIQQEPQQSGGFVQVDEEQLPF